MVRIQGESSNQKQRALPVVSKLALREGVPPDGQTSNQILDILAEWNTYLEAHVPYYQELGL